MNLKDFYAIIDSEKNLDKSMIADLQNLIKRYPFFQAGLFLYIKSLYVTDSDLFSSELQRISTFIHDRKALFYYVMDDVFKQFQKQNNKQLEKDRTNILINAFFETHENIDLDIQLEKAISNTNMGSSDYFAVAELLPEINEPENILEDELEVIDDNNSQQIILTKSAIDEVSGPIIGEIIADEKNINKFSEIELKHQDLIDSFISKAQDSESLRIKITPNQEVIEEENTIAKEENVDEELDDDFFFTQTLANIYIKQKKYDRAYEIIKRLSLNYPEKNSYFADQLSFLEKAVKNLKK